MTHIKKILLFGGTGFVGSAIVDRLKDVYTIVAPTHSELDVTDFDFLREKITLIQPDLIIYAGGLASVDRCEEEMDLARLLNTKVPTVIAEIAVTLHIPVYYISTDAIFRGNKKDYAYKENDKVDPFSIYGKTKAAGEEAILNHSSKNAVIRIICPFNSFYDKKTDFVRLAVKKLSNKEKFTGIIDQIMNPLYIPYLTEALFKLVSKNAYGIYHLGATDSDSNYTIIKCLAEILKLDNTLLVPITLKTFMENKKSLRSQYSSLDVSKFQKEFGDRTLHTIEKSLRDFSEDIKRI